ncbi:MAG: putative addiction module antidote protein [Proteobacteria bacterium]|nr:putative addiction module antidote protein [Pseudomonadota bacterium]
MKNTVSYEDNLIDSLKDPEEAAIYLQVAFDEYQEDGHMEAFLLALSNVAKAQGGIAKLAEKTNLNRQNLYRILSKTGNPTLDTLGAIIKQLGFVLTIRPIAVGNHR